MKALREWLIKHEWFIAQCDPNPAPGLWFIDAVSPAGIGWQWKGTETEIHSGYPVSF